MASSEDIEELKAKRLCYRCDFDSDAMGEETEFSSESYYEEKGAARATTVAKIVRDLC